MIRRAIKLTLLATAMLLAPGLVPHGQPADLLAVARRDLGLSEVRNRAYIRRMVGLDPVRQPWCAAWAGAKVRQAGLTPPAGYHASASWRRWRGAASCRRGAVAVFRRHIAFVSRVEGRWVWVIGGNQRNGVTEKRVARATIMSCRR